MQKDSIDTNREQLHFWALGDLHYRAITPWKEFQSQRFTTLFNDLHALWQADGKPAFCVSPGDIIETCAQENYALAKTSLQTALEEVPFYPGVGNHEFHGPDGENPSYMLPNFTAIWDKPARYTWQAGNVTCIMLDYPDPLTLADPAKVFISQETLAFLDGTLAAHPNRPAIIFLHCPLRNTVMDRDPGNSRDYNSRQSFFSPENSQEVRNILARHRQSSLFISGHTHTGWEAPNIVVTEQFEDHPVTFVNLMSPWYTGTQTGPRFTEDWSWFEYKPDNPNVIPTFSIRIYQEYASIRVRDHLSQRWLKEWMVPMFTLL